MCVSIAGARTHTHTNENHGAVLGGRTMLYDDEKTDVMVVNDGERIT